MGKVSDGASLLDKTLYWGELDTVKNRTSDQGFTLIEVVVVMAIIGILLAIALPAYEGYVLRTKIRVAKSDLMTLLAHIEQYRQRTLTIPVDQSAAMHDWLPASRTDEFSFAYLRTDDTRGRDSYQVVATALPSLGKAARCALILDNDNGRHVTEPCRQVGENTW